MKKFDCTKPTVSKSISSLSKNGYIISLIKKDLQEKGLMDSDND